MPIYVETTSSTAAARAIMWGASNAGAGPCNIEGDFVTGSYLIHIKNTLGIEVRT